MYFELILSALLVAAYVVGTRIVNRLMTAVAERKSAAPKRAIYISKVFSFGIAALALILLSLIWGVDYASVFVLASSIFVILGVAFFAQWSILSNVTASIVIFFSYPSRIGDQIRIVDGDNSLEGEIVDINLFQVLIRDNQGNLVTYPNNLIIQKPLVKIEDDHSDDQTHIV